MYSLAVYAGRTRHNEQQKKHIMEMPFVKQSPYNLVCWFEVNMNKRKNRNDDHCSKLLNV